MATMRGACEFAGGTGICRHLHCLYHDVNRQLLSGDATQLRPAGLSQHDRKQRPGRPGSQLQRRVFHHRVYLRHVVHHRVYFTFGVVAVQVRILQGHHEHIRRAGHTTVLRRTRRSGMQ